MFHIDIVTTLFRKVSFKIHVDITCFSTSRSMSTFHNLRELMSYWDKFGDLSCTLAELTSFGWFIHLLHLWTLLKIGIFVDPKICPKPILFFFLLFFFLFFFPSLFFTPFFSHSRAIAKPYFSFLFFHLFLLFSLLLFFSFLFVFLSSIFPFYLFIYLFLLLL